WGSVSFFFFNDTATTEIYTLSLHDALPISYARSDRRARPRTARLPRRARTRSEEHTSELQSLTNLVCRLLLEKKQELNEAARCESLRRGRIGHRGAATAA